MNELSSPNPDLSQMFMNGHYAVRRSDLFWGAVSTNLFTEQEMMRPVKKTGVLTRGLGITELCCYQHGCYQHQHVLKSNKLSILS